MASFVASFTDDLKGSLIGGFISDAVVSFMDCFISDVVGSFLGCFKGDFEQFCSTLCHASVNELLVSYL